jgi:hypothetical protein
MDAAAEPQRPAAWCCVAALAGFMLLQSSAATAVAALPLLALLATVAGGRGELDLARAPTFAEGAWLALIAAWGLGVAGSDDVARSLAVSVPAVAASLGAILLARAHWTDATRGALVAAVLCVAAVQAAQVLVAALIGGHGGAAVIVAADVPWLVVPNDLAWTGLSLALLPTLRRLAPGRAVFGLGAAVALVVAGAAVCAQSRLALLVVVLALAPFAGRRALVVVAALAGIAALVALSWGKGLASLESRLELWSAALDLGLAHPGNGIGPGGFDSAVERLAPAQERVDPRAMPWPHSLPLEAFALLGVPGLLALSAIAAAGLRRTRGRTGAAILVAVAAIALVEASLLRVWCWWGLSLLLHWPTMTPAKEDCR